MNHLKRNIRLPKFINKLFPILQKLAQTNEELWERSKKQNDELYADVQAISESDWNYLARRIRTYSKIRGFTNEWTEIWVTHRYRLWFSINWLREIIQQTNKEYLALELGGESLPTDFLREEFPFVKWKNTTGDLRAQWDIPDETHDLIVAMEVIEHLSDIPDQFNDGFLKTGLKAVLRECYRVLKPGGYLFITTPNAGSILHLEKALAGASPWFYLLHTREYTIEEIIQEFLETNFKVINCKAIHCLTIDHNRDYSKVFEMLFAYQYHTNNRGDDLFIIVQK